MAKDIERVQIHKSLVCILEDIRLNVANDMKKKYKLNSIEVPRTLSSRILAAKHKNKKINFKVRKTSLTKGVLELI